MGEISTINVFKTKETIRYKCDTCNIGFMVPIGEIHILTLKQLHTCTFCRDTKNLNNSYPIIKDIKSY